MYLHTATHLIFALTPALPSALTAHTSAQEVDAEHASEWRQWRGPGRDGQSPGTSWPESLDAEHLSLAWRTDDLGPSYSGPIVADGRVFTTETVDEEREVVRAYDRKSGEELWATEWEGAMEVPFFAARNGSWIRSTPAFDEGSLYVAGMRDVLVCLAADSGEVRWRVDFTEALGSALPPFGFVCSPLVAGRFVFVQAGSSVVKLDKETGDVVWRAMHDGEDMMQAGAFSSPVIAELSGARQLLVQSRTQLAGLAPDTGSELWSLPVKSFRGMNILTPSVHGNAVFTSTYGGGSQLVGFIAEDGATRAEPLWQNSAQGYMSSPVVIAGHAYVFMRSNRVSCIDLASGDVAWTSPPTGDSYWSLVARGDQILALADTGTLRLLRADPAEYAVLAERQLVEDEAWAHVAPAGNQLFVRGLESLYAFEWK